MKNSNLLVFGMLLLGIIFLGFQCSSTELTSAKLYIDQKNWDKALAMLQTEVQKNPKSDEGYFLLGTVYSKLDSVEKMLDAFENSLAISNKFKQQIDQVKYETWGGTMNKGLGFYNKSVKSTDKDTINIFLDKAIPNFQTAIVVEPDSGLGYHYLAISFLRKGNYDEAVDPLKKLIDLEQSEIGYQYLGEIYCSKGDEKMNEFKNNKNPSDSVEAVDYYNKGISVLEEGLTKFPENSEMLGYKTQAYIGAGRINEAITSAKSLVEKEPDNAVYHYNYGVLLLNVENYQNAETQLLKALELDPNYENAIYNIAVTYVKWGTAMNLEAEAKGILSEDYKQKYQKALPYLEKVVELDAKNPQMWELIGKVYSVLGMNDDANNAFKKADELK